MWYSTSSGRIELNIPEHVVRACYHSGACDDDVAHTRRTEPDVEAQLQAIDPALLRAELAEYGAWNGAELADHDANLDRLLWLACGDLAEQDADKD